MKTRILGKTGFEVSEIGLGCWQLGGDFGPISQEIGNSVIENAWDSRIRFWDTADVYGNGTSEKIIGQWRAQNILNAEQTQVAAKAPIVATKVGRTGDLFPDKYNKATLKANIQTSAKHLKVDTIDLIQLHCVPFEVLKDGEIFTWLKDLQDEGLIRHYGASVETIEEGLYCLQDEGLASLQTIFNIFRQDAIDTLLPKAQANNVGIIVRLPLASGLLSGKFAIDHQFSTSDHRNFNRDGQAFHVGETFSGLPFEKGVELVKELNAYVPEGMNMAQWALRWILDQPGVSTVIAGASRESQVVSNAMVSQMPSLDASVHQELRSFYQEKVRPFIRGAI